MPFKLFLNVKRNGDFELQNGQETDNFTYLPVIIPTMLDTYKSFYTAENVRESSNKSNQWYSSRTVHLTVWMDYILETTQKKH